jgi:hypothetical protein
MHSRACVVLVGTLLAACSSSSTTDGGPDSGADTAACLSYANALCGLYASCSNGWYAATLYGDEATCVARNQASCVQRLQIPGTAQTPNGIQTCASALSTATCEDLYGDTITACNPPMGMATSGAGCGASAQCASSYCGVPTDQVCGTCQTQPAQGDSCATLACGPGLHCLDTVQTCAPLVVDGGACKADGDCQFGLVCLSKSQFCAPTVDAGDSCDYTGRVGPGCNNRLGIMCLRQGDGGTCERRGLADAGDPCGNVVDGGVATDCIAFGFCQKAEPDAGTGICLAAAADGTACDTNVGPNCIPPSRCVPSPTGDGFAGTCEALYPASCTSGGMGTGGSTTGGSTSGGTGGTTGGGNTDFPASGTFNASGADGGSLASATLIDFDASLAQFLAVGTGYQFSIAAVNGDGMSSATFTSPTGITNYTFTSSIVFPNAPVVGSISSTASCGNIGFNFGTTDQSFNYVAQVAGANCNGQVQGGGSWTLTFTSVSGPGGPLGNDYTAHGSLVASMPDATGDTGALNLAF